MDDIIYLREVQAGWLEKTDENDPIGVKYVAERRCKWREHNTDYMPGTYETGCGNIFTFMEGGPADNEARYCQYCGGILHVED